VTTLCRTTRKRGLRSGEIWLLGSFLCCLPLAGWLLGYGLAGSNPNLPDKTPLIKSSGSALAITRPTPTVSAPMSEKSSTSKADFGKSK